MTNTKLVVEVLHATNLSPKDGEGSANPFVEVEFDSQRLRTDTKTKDLNPVWNKKLEFTISHMDILEDECIEVHAYTAKKGGHRTALGKTKIDGSHVRRKGVEGYDKPVGFPLERGWGVFSSNKGEVFLKLYYFDEEKEKAKQQQQQATSASLPLSSCTSRPSA